MIPNWAWAAGFFDGEGHVGIHPLRMPSGVWYQATATIRNTHEPTLRQFAALLASIDVSARLRLDRRCPPARDSVMLQVTGMESLRRFGLALYPHLVTKRFQWAVVLEYIESRLSKKRGAYTERELALIAIASTMNQRGRVASSAPL